MKKVATTPPISKLELRFPTGLTVTARNKKGVTIKDCLDVIWKQYRKKVLMTFSVAIKGIQLNIPRFRESVANISFRPMMS